MERADIREYVCQRCGITRQYTQSRRRPTHCRDCNAELQKELGRQLGRDWVTYASCREVDPEYFHDKYLIEAGHYRKICGSCPVNNECLMEAHANRETYGIWGGITISQRRYLVDRGAGPTQSKPGDVTRCRNCGAWKESHRFCNTCVDTARKRRME